MAKRNKSILPGLIDKGKKPSSLDGIKNASGNRSSSALPIMKYFGDVKPSRNERIIKPDMTSGGKVAKQDLPTIREVLKPGFSSNFRTNYTPPSAFDADALAYFTAAGITDTDEKNAVNQLVLDLKGTGSTPNGTDLWTNAVAIWPVSPTSLDAAAYNLRDTALFNYTWVNSPIHASTGVSFNGINNYGDTNLSPASISLANGYDITIAIQIANSDPTSVGLFSGRYGTVTNQRTQLMLINGSMYQDFHSATNRLITSTGGTYNGRFIATADRVANGGKINYLNGSSIGTLSSQDDGNPYTYNLFTGAQNAQSSPTPSVVNASNFEYRFGYILNEGLNSTAVADLDDAIVRYSTALSRNI